MDSIIVSRLTHTLTLSLCLGGNAHNNSVQTFVLILCPVSRPFDYVHSARNSAHLFRTKCAEFRAARLYKRGYMRLSNTLQ